jgi:hypothetical protein
MALFHPSVAVGFPMGLSEAFGRGMSALALLPARKEGVKIELNVFFA